MEINPIKTTDTKPNKVQFISDEIKDTVAKVVTTASLSLSGLGMLLLSNAHSHALVIGSISLSVAGTFTSMLASRYLKEEKTEDSVLHDRVRGTSDLL